MSLLVDLFGFLSVLARGFALGLAAIAIGGVIFRAMVLAGPLSTGAPVTPAWVASSRILKYSSLALLLVTLTGKGLDVTVLLTQVGVPLGHALTAPFALAGIASVLAAGWLGFGAYRHRPLFEWLAAVVLLASLVATTHATGRIDARAWLIGVSALHQLAGAAWIGGLPYFLATLQLPVAVHAPLAQRFSHVCVGSVLVIAATAVAKYIAYLGVPAAAYGTAYGLMTMTKAVMFFTLLAFGAANYFAVRNLRTVGAASSRTQRFVEVELAIGVGLFFVAGSLTSLPPAVDLPNDRVPWHLIVERVLTPKMPQLKSPDHAELWYETEQAKLNASAFAAREEAPRAFVPGAGILYPRGAADMAWSEFNHNWAGVFVLAIGLLALLARHPSCRFAQHWPMVFVALGFFIAIRADPESWPLGSIGFFEAFREPGVVQHRLMTLLVIVFGLFEWRVRVGNLADTAAMYVFPVSNVLGGILMLTHSHVLENIQEALLIEMSHIPIGLFAITAGCARWLELRAPSPIKEHAAWVWPLAFVATGLTLLFYRES